MSFPQPEWTAIANLAPPSRWADLADRIALVEHGIRTLGEQLGHTIDRVQELIPTSAEADELWWQCEAVRRSADRLPTDVEHLDELLAELFDEFGPKVKHSLGQRNVQWREGPWHTLEPRTDDDG